MTYCLCSVWKRFFAEFEGQKEHKIFFTQIQKFLSTMKLEAILSTKYFRIWVRKNLISFWTSNSAKNRASTKQRRKIISKNWELTLFILLQGFKTVSGLESLSVLLRIPMPDRYWKKRPLLCTKTVIGIFIFWIRNFH